MLSMLFRCNKLVLGNKSVTLDFGSERISSSIGSKYQGFGSLKRSRRIMGDKLHCRGKT